MWSFQLTHSSPQFMTPRANFHPLASFRWLNMQSLVLKYTSSSVWAHLRRQGKSSKHIKTKQTVLTRKNDNIVCSNTKNDMLPSWANNNHPLSIRKGWSCMTLSYHCKNSSIAVDVTPNTAVYSHCSLIRNKKKVVTVHRKSEFIHKSFIIQDWDYNSKTNVYTNPGKEVEWFYLKLSI